VPDTRLIQKVLVLYSGARGRFKLFKGKKLIDNNDNRYYYHIMIRKSEQREEIFKILSVKNYHPTAEEIYLEVKKVMPQVGIASIYRNIEQLVGLNKIVKIDLGKSSARFDGNTEEHYHIICQKCGDIQDVFLDLNLDNYYKDKNYFNNYQVWGHKIIFQGLCLACQNAN